MRAVTPFRYLLGDLDAAREIAASPSAVAVGLLFVASAALAREYDGVYLAAEPVHLALPFVASLGAASIMFGALWLALMKRGGPRPPFTTTFVRWLALFLWTAPLAWVYAIPWERLLEPAGAARANLATLGLVAAWRVALMTRAGAQLLGAPPRAVATILLGVSSPIVLLGLLADVLPLVATMGGLRLPEGAAAAARVSKLLLPFALLLCPVLLLATLSVIWTRSPPWTPAAVEPPATRAFGALGVALAALLIGVGLTFDGQHEQARAYEVEQAVFAGDTDGALRLLGAREASDFPPHWVPPPEHPAHDDSVGRLLSMVEAVQRAPATPAWVRARYVETLCRMVEAAAWGRSPLRYDFALGRRTALALAALTDDEATAMLAAHPQLTGWLKDVSSDEVEGDRAALKAARKRLGVPEPAPAPR